MQKCRQMEFEWPLGHGGARKGAGRKRRGVRPRVSHKRRAGFKRSCPLHVTCRVQGGLPSLRDLATVKVLMDFFARACKKAGFRVVEFSIQTNHIHMVCEAEDQAALSKAMQILLSTMAKLLNRHWGRKGKVFEDRYHFEPLETPTQCRNAVIYVLHNAKKHGSRHPRSLADPCSTAPWYPFSDFPSTRRDTKPAASPRTWLLREGLLLVDPIHLQDLPHIPKTQVASAR